MALQGNTFGTVWCNILWQTLRDCSARAASASHGLGLQVAPAYCCHPVSKTASKFFVFEQTDFHDSISWHILKANRGETICCEALWQDDPRDEESWVLHHPPGLPSHRSTSNTNANFQWSWSNENTEALSNSLDPKDRYYYDATAPNTHRFLAQGDILLSLRGPGLGSVHQGLRYGDFFKLPQIIANLHIFCFL